MSTRGSTPQPAVEIEATPPQAADVFGPALPRVLRYVELLAGPGVVRGLIGPREPARLWTRHVLNSAALAGLLPRDADVVDVGSGAGLPGVPLALARPDVRMTLLEPMARRVAFLHDVATELALDVQIHRGRVEDFPPGSVDAVVVRALAPLQRLLPLTLPLLRPHGRLLALKGSTADAEIVAAQDVLRRWPLARVSRVAASAGAATATVVVVDLDGDVSPAKDRER